VTTIAAPGWDSAVRHDLLEPYARLAIIRAMIAHAPLVRALVEAIRDTGLVSSGTVFTA